MMCIWQALYTTIRVYLHQLSAPDDSNVAVLWQHITSIGELLHNNVAVWVRYYTALSCKLHHRPVQELANISKTWTRY